MSGLGLLHMSGKAGDSVADICADTVAAVHDRTNECTVGLRAAVLVTVVAIRVGGGIVDVRMGNDACVLGTVEAFGGLLDVSIQGEVELVELLDAIELNTQERSGLVESLRLTNSEAGGEEAVEVLIIFEGTSAN